MIVEMKVPSPGESITEVQIARWIKKDGDIVEKDEDICEIDSDKATLTLPAEESGMLKILVKEGETATVGSIVCTIDTDKSVAGKDSGTDVKKNTEGNVASSNATSVKKEESTKASANPATETKTYASGTPSVAAEKIMREKNIKSDDVQGTGKDGRITKGDVQQTADSKSQTGKSSAVSSAASSSTSSSVPSSNRQSAAADNRKERREKMSMLRKRVAERLVAAKQETAMLTTFNEVDMSAIMHIRKQYKDKFKEVHGVSLGFMSFFTKAVCQALKAFPTVNAQIDGDEIIHFDYCDIGIAVSAPKGLMVPVIRNAESLSMAEIEQKVVELATKARDGKLAIDEMKGGTFTITNGGVFGSMLSTPIINPPQSAILGMHNIVERPVARDGKVEIRPIMYVALSYDHRIIDGKESVSFLVMVKQLLEEPVKLEFEGLDPLKDLLKL